MFEYSVEETAQLRLPYTIHYQIIQKNQQTEFFQFVQTHYHQEVLNYQKAYTRVINFYQGCIQYRELFHRVKGDIIRNDILEFMVDVFTLTRYAKKGKCLYIKADRIIQKAFEELLKRSPTYTHRQDIFNIFILVILSKAPIKRTDELLERTVLPPLSFTQSYDEDHSSKSVKQKPCNVDTICIMENRILEAMTNEEGIKKFIEETSAKDLRAIFSHQQKYKIKSVNVYLLNYLFEICSTEVIGLLINKITTKWMISFAFAFDFTDKKACELMFDKVLFDKEVLWKKYEKAAKLLVYSLPLDLDLAAYVVSRAQEDISCLPYSQSFRQWLTGTAALSWERYPQDQALYENTVRYIGKHYPEETQKDLQILKEKQKEVLAFTQYFFTHEKEYISSPHPYYIFSPDRMRQLKAMNQFNEGCSDQIIDKMFEHYFTNYYPEDIDKAFILGILMNTADKNLQKLCDQMSSQVLNDILHENIPLRCLIANYSSHFALSLLNKVVCIEDHQSDFDTIVLPYILNNKNLLGEHSEIKKKYSKEIIKHNLDNTIETQNDNIIERRKCLLLFFSQDKKNVLSPTTLTNSK